MTEDEFWKLIDHIDRRTLQKGEGYEEEAVEPLVEALADFPRAELKAFEVHLAQMLSTLEGHDFAEAAEASSDDGFLYARCFVVAMGRTFYERTRLDPNLMSKTIDNWCEPLLYAAELAWEQKTGHEWDYSGGVSSETGSNKPKRIGVILQGELWHAVVEGLREGLRRAGLEEGRDLELTVRDIAYDLNAVEALARELERDGVDLIVPITTPVARATKRATKDVPIVFVSAVDPVFAGLVDSIPRPGGRLTGVHDTSGDLTSKRLQILREIMPVLRRVIMFCNPHPVGRENIKLARDAARSLGLDLVERGVTSVQEIRDRLSEFSTADAEAFLFPNDLLVRRHSALILDRTTSLRMPAMGTQPDFVRRGAVAAYGINYHDVGRQAASLVHRILGGARPSDISVEIVTRITLAINLKAAAALGLTMPNSIRLPADEVIE